MSDLANSVMRTVQLIVWNLNWFRTVQAWPGHCALFDCVLEEAAECAHAILPADLLAFFVGAAPVSDADLVNPQSPLGDLHRDLRLETEAVFLDGDGLNHFAAEDFIARLHIAEVDVGEAIREQC